MKKEMLWELFKQTGKIEYYMKWKEMYMIPLLEGIPQVTRAVRTQNDFTFHYSFLPFPQP